MRLFLALLMPLFAVAGCGSEPGLSPDLSVSDAATDLSVSDAAAIVMDMTPTRFDDGGLPCPGAAIFHPGSESRVVNTSVPFVGRGRDPNCGTITGSNLVWTDNMEGQIGTGETFNHTFTTVGSHTVTLSALDGAATYTATVTFPITP